MAGHEYFEELSAAASLGEASGAELAELREHMTGCPSCREAYADFTRLSAVRSTNGMSKEKIGADEAIGYIDSGLLRQKFLKRAEAEGVVFSHANARAETSHRRVATSSWTLRLALPVAAALLLVVGLAGGYYWKSAKISASAGNEAHATVASATMPNGPPDGGALREVARLQTENQKLTAQIASLKTSVAEQTKIALDIQESAAVSDKERGRLAAELRQRETRISELEGQISQTQVQLASFKSQLDSDKANENALASERMHVRELSDQLTEQTAAVNRERDMLAADRDIRELMAARNLHIADVFDTDAKGKTRPALGRIFFTEGKSLIFYAYDLNDNRVQNAGYNYRVWGKKEGRGQQAKSLGIFYSDDKAQKRWVFKYDDPKVLSEIDSVFVTLEPPGKNPIAPQGDKLLYAYLRNQANHP